MRKPPRPSNLPAKYFFVKRQEARAWRASLASGRVTPPPVGNPYITRDDYLAYYRMRSKKY